jgi:phosphoenolpyruvate carboxykinase (GTP)
MTEATTHGLAITPTTHPRLLAWVREVAELTTPDRIYWCDGSDTEWQWLTSELVQAGTLVKLDEGRKPNSFWARTDPSDVARVEERTFICSPDEQDAGPVNRWMAPAAMKRLMSDLYRGSMTGRTMYVIPFCMGPLTPKTPSSASRSPTARTSRPA